jgi:CheY-like chemotaxis protein
MNKTTSILLVGDDPADVRLIREAQRDSRIPNELHGANDGLSANRSLEQSGTGDRRPVSDLVLLDLNLPKLNGQEVLQRIKEHEVWKMIPVVALATSSSQRDVRACYGHHVNCFSTKPMAFDAFLDAVERIEYFWLTLVRLPRSK